MRTDATSQGSPAPSSGFRGQETTTLVLARRVTNNAATFRIGPQLSTMANVTELNDGNFKATLDNSRLPVLVDFTASWCGPCRALAPTIDKVAEDYSGRLEVYKVDIDAAQETVMAFGIQQVPTVIFFKEGREVDRFYGGKDLVSVKNHVERVLD
jgi:thioredoxin 1